MLKALRTIFKNPFSALSAVPAVSTVSAVRFLGIFLLAAALLLPAALPKNASAAPARDSSAAGPDELDGAGGPTFLLANHSHNDLVALRMFDGQTTSFARMDLGPGGEDEVENPGGTVELRLDLGLTLCTWDKLSLDKVRRLTLCPEHEHCLVVEQQSGTSAHVRGTASSLLPKPGDKPVCALDGFHSGMTMKEACGLINTYYTMEEDVYLTTLGFANIAWSARLYANTDSGGSLEDAVLENVELRQKISLSTLRAVQKTLARQDYVPWQATFPGMEFTFSDMQSIAPQKQLEILSLCTETFLAQGRGSAAITYAPASLIRTLAASEFPASSVQLYTVSLHRDSDTLVLDMTAYNVEDPQN